MLLSCLYRKIDFLWNRETSIIHRIQISTAGRPHEPHKGYLVKFYSFSFKLSLCICDTLSYIQVTNVTHFTIPEPNRIRELSGKVQTFTLSRKHRHSKRLLNLCTWFEIGIRGITGFSRSLFCDINAIISSLDLSLFAFVHIKGILRLMAKYRDIIAYNHVLIAIR